MQKESLMHQVNISEAKTHLSRLIQEVRNGKEVIIARGNKPVARLVPLDSEKPQRRLGALKGMIHMADDFDAPLEDFAPYMPDDPP